MDTFPQAKTSLNISAHTLCWRGQQLATCNKAYVWRRSISLTLLLIGSFRYRAFTSRIKPFTICFGRIQNLSYFFCYWGTRCLHYNKR